jgi:hypothetical protein
MVLLVRDLGGITEAATAELLQRPGRVVPRTRGPGAD